MTTPKTSTAIDLDVLATKVVSQLQQKVVADEASKPQIVLRIARRMLTEKELENISLQQKQAGEIAYLSHGELSQGRLITTVDNNTIMTIQDVEFGKAALAGYRCVLPLDGGVNNEIFRILADLDMRFHAKNGVPEGASGGVVFSVVVQADAFDIQESTLDDKLQVVPVGKFVVSPAQPLPDTREIDLKARLQAAEAERQANLRDASSRREANRRNRLAPASNAMAQSVAGSEQSLENLASADA